MLPDKASEIASNPKYGGYQRGIPLMLYKFFDKRSGDNNSHLEAGIDIF